MNIKRYKIVSAAHAFALQSMADCAHVDPALSDDDCGQWRYEVLADAMRAVTNEVNRLTAHA